MHHADKDPAEARQIAQDVAKREDGPPHPQCNLLMLMRKKIRY